MLRFFLIVFAVLCLGTPVLAADTAATYYHHAFAAIESGDAPKAEIFAQRGFDPVLNKVVRGLAMALPKNDYSFESLNAFMTANPTWPGLKGIQMIAEQKLPADAVASQIVDWFTVHPPVTLVGFYRYVDALNATGHASEAENAIRARWISEDFTGDEQTVFYQRYGSVIGRDTMWARMDRLLWKDDDQQARRMMPYLDADLANVAEARMSLQSQSRNAEMWVSRVPSAMQGDPGLQYQLLRWRVKNNMDDDADDLLLRVHPAFAKGTPGAEAWWELREVMTRRALLRRDYELAYRLASGHGESDPKLLTQGEFLSGWIALRFLNDPNNAVQHFQNLYDNATAPLSLARGGYWLGRTYEELGDKNSAAEAYKSAASYNTCFYGQLAATRIYTSPLLTAKADPPLPESVRHKYLEHDAIRAITALADLGETDYARKFFHAAVEAATERSEFIMLTEIAGKMHRPDLGIQAVKDASKKNMLIETGGFPLISMKMPTPPESAFTHALIRQESMFNPDASSGVGARGLMQLMPSTAKDVARHLGIRYKESLLGEPSYNLKLGTTFVQEQIEHFNGSYILALAGYNAGPGRVHEWTEQFGDPRNSDVDPVDWIEMIPIRETRNYVQRILESLQIYRAKLAGGQHQLLIINDLHR